MKTKTELAIERYKEVCSKVYGKEPKLEVKGTWVYINDSPTAHRISKLDEYADRLLENDAYERTFNLDELDEDNLDVKTIVQEIHEDGKKIFLSKSFKEMQRIGLLISKKAKTALNLMEEDE